MSDVTLTHEPGVIYLQRDGRRAGHLDYSLSGDTMRIHYVEVDPSCRGTGLGRRLVDAAAVWARQEGKRIVPICGYARSVLAGTPKYAGLVSS